MMDLLEFTRKQNERTGDVAPALNRAKRNFEAKEARRFPLVIRWPPTARVAVIGEHWRRDDQGHLLATYHTIEELRLAIQITQWINEGAYHQTRMFPRERTNYNNAMAM